MFASRQHTAASLLKAPIIGRVITIVRQCYRFRLPFDLLFTVVVLVAIFAEQVKWMETQTTQLT